MTTHDDGKLSGIGVVDTADYTLAVVDIRRLRVGHPEVPFDRRRHEPGGGDPAARHCDDCSRGARPLATVLEHAVLAQSWFPQ